MQLNGHCIFHSGVDLDVLLYRLRVDRLVSVIEMIVKVTGTHFMMEAVPMSSHKLCCVPGTPCKLSNVYTNITATFIIISFVV